MDEKRTAANTIVTADSAWHYLGRMLRLYPSTTHRTFRAMFPAPASGWTISEGETWALVARVMFAA